MGPAAVELGCDLARPIAMPATRGSSTGTASGRTEEDATADCRAGSAREETFEASYDAGAICAVVICVISGPQATASRGTPETPGEAPPRGQKRRIRGIQRQKPPCSAT